LCLSLVRFACLPFGSDLVWSHSTLLKEREPATLGQSMSLSGSLTTPLILSLILAICSTIIDFLSLSGLVWTLNFRFLLLVCYFPLSMTSLM
jgi:hypothetical protein